MKKYVVGVLNFFGGGNKLYVVDAENGIEAIQGALMKSHEDTGRSGEDYVEWFKSWKVNTEQEAIDKAVEGDFNVTLPMELE